MTSPIPLLQEAALATKSIYESGKYSDLMISCNGTEFLVHCAIVCPRLDRLAAKVDRWNEKKALSGDYRYLYTRIDLPDEEPLIVQKMLDFIYTSDYQDRGRFESKKRDCPTSPATVDSDSDSVLVDSLDSDSLSDFVLTPNSSSNSSVTETGDLDYEPLLLNAKVFVLAHRFHLPELKRLASNKYKAALDSPLSDPSACASFCASFTYLWDNFSEDDRDLKDFLLASIGWNMKSLLASDKFVNLVNSSGEVGFSILNYHSQSFKPRPVPEEESDEDMGFGLFDYPH